MTPRTGEIRIGTSGWAYPHWLGEYYPDDLPQTQWPVKYASDFNTVEINNTFCQLPETKALEQWFSDVSKDFVFSVKAIRYITHMKNSKTQNRP